MDERPEIRFTTTDDEVSIAFWEIGDGRPVVLIQNWGLSHAELEWSVPSMRRFYESLAERYRLVRFDPRGIGLSGDPPGGWGAESESGVQVGMTLRHQCLDIDAVVAALRLERFSLMAVSVFGPVGIEYVATHGDTVDKLILYDAMAEVRGGHLGATLEAQRAVGVVENRSEGHHPIPISPWTALIPNDERSTASRLEHSAHGRIHWTKVQPQLEWDASNRLAAVLIPTLILCSRNPLPSEPSVMSDSQRLAASIKESRLNLVEGAYSPYFETDQEGVLQLIDAFLMPERRISRTPATFRTVVFTDIVDSTKFINELGDEKGRGAFRDLEKIVANLAGLHGGTVIKNLGDGSLVSFGSNTGALRFGLDVQAQTRDSSLKIRVGMAAGEPIDEDGDIHGAVVAYASRIADLGGAGEVVASDTVRQLAMGKEFQFTLMGQFELKGFEERAKVWRVSAP